ncbi:MAG TPA: outer membrane beta-barrel protein [Saprospiraceae bacterium]|nr:outer membrane beta-barrel protein [Saprospiraceae bacterium]
MKYLRGLKLLGLIIISIVFLNPFCSNAQTSYNPNAGLHLSAIDGNFKDSSVLNSRVGWQIGLDLRKGSGIFFFNPGIHYRVTSADIKKSIEINGSLTNLVGSTTIQTIAVPLNGGIYLTGSEPALIRIYINGGVIPSYILGIKSPEKYDLNPSEFNRFQLGLSVGAGIDLLFLHFGATYETYLQNYFQNVNGKNRILTFSIGFVF